MSRSVVSTTGVDVTPFRRELLAMIDAEDFSGVKRKVFTDLAKQGVVPSDEFLDEGVLALRQYYVVALLDPTNRHAVSDVIDPFWHAHILHTKQYIDFCDRVFGQYIQHESSPRLPGTERLDLSLSLLRGYGRSRPLHGCDSPSRRPRRCWEARLGV
ncbi:hypothetical protein [Frankia gtarii]|uniref:hypothetical protein n=1 Tax=Frankia gtarii TaxID=2950102 RepID=UPI0021C232C9|nr:hypothetical protein [Frankia gtarii]